MMNNASLEFSTDYFLDKMASNVCPNLNMNKSYEQMKQELIHNCHTINAMFTSFNKIIDADELLKTPDELIMHIYIIVMYIINIKKTIFAKRMQKGGKEIPHLALLKLTKNYKSPELHNLHSVVIHYTFKKSNRVSEIADNTNINVMTLLSESDIKKFNELNKKNKLASAKNKRKKIKTAIDKLKQDAYRESQYNKELAVKLYKEKIRNFKEYQKEIVTGDDSDDIQYDDDEYNFDEIKVNNNQVIDVEYKKPLLSVFNAGAKLKHNNIEPPETKTLNTEDSELLFEMELEKKNKIEIIPKSIVSEPADDDVPDDWDS